MEERPSAGRRALRLLAFSIGGGVALAIGMASSSSAQEVVVQDAEVVNAGVGAANSGGNVAVANDSENTATTNQTATGVVAANTGSSSSSSNGTATISTGAATGVGSSSSTDVGQSASGGGGGPTVAVQEADVVNAGAGLANSGGNVAVANTSDNSATTNQVAVGAVAANVADTSATSNGTAVITTGPATGIGNLSRTGIAQGAGGGGGGVLIAVQDADVVNGGIGLANSGFNLAVGNDSDTTATTNQVALGLLAFNVAGGGGASSDGTAIVSTGAATGIGNMSGTGITQIVGGGGPAVVVQTDTVLDLGIGLANSGFNPVFGNTAVTNSNVLQVALGLLAFNVNGGGGASSNGLAVVNTGNATGIGNISWTKILQLA
jgi:hypothetical protein